MKKTIVWILAVLLLFSGCVKVSVKTQETTAQQLLEDRSFEIDTQTSANAQTTAQAKGSSGTANESTTAGVGTTNVADTTKQTGSNSQSVPAMATTAPPATRQTNIPTAANTTVPVSAATQPPAVSTTAAPPTTDATTAAPATTQKQTDTCTVRIECATIKDNMKKLKNGKAAFVPSGGVILDDAVVELQAGDTAFSVLQRACKENVCVDNCRYCQNGGIQIEYTFTPGFNTYYVEGIHQIYEKDCGTLSGWMFSLNGQFPEVGASSVTVSPGDRIVFCYTCDMGDDVGNHFEG